MSLRNILDVWETPAGKNALWLVLKVSVNGNTPETIINPTDNIKSKVDYLSHAYNEDLTLKRNPQIKIVRFSFIQHSEDLIEELLKEGEREGL